MIYAYNVAVNCLFAITFSGYVCGDSCICVVVFVLCNVSCITCVMFVVLYIQLVLCL